MTEDKYLIESNSRGVIEINGPDRVNFLQGLVSNDVELVAPDRAIYAALLTPQGKFLYDFFISTEDNHRLFLECERVCIPRLLSKLKVYKLRSQVDLIDRNEEFKIYLAYGKDTLSSLNLPNVAGKVMIFEGGQAIVDPRLPALGARIRLPIKSSIDELKFKGGTLANYNKHRISLGVPDGIHDMQQEKTTLLEAGFDELNGVSWTKGCYMGQELTARTKYRGLIKRRLLPCKVIGTEPKPGTKLSFQGKEVGEIKSVADGVAIALLKLNAVAEAIEQNSALEAENSSLVPVKPDWANF